MRLACLPDGVGLVVGKLGAFALATAHDAPAAQATALLGHDGCLTFGTVILVEVDHHPVPQGFAPLAWMYDVPVLVLVGELTAKPVVVDGKVEAREVLPITATIDHRYADGWHISKLMTAFREYLAAPERFEPAISRAAERSVS